MCCQDLDLRNRNSKRLCESNDDELLLIVEVVGEEEINDGFILQVVEGLDDTSLHLFLLIISNVDVIDDEVLTRTQELPLTSITTWVVIIIIIIRASLLFILESHFNDLTNSVLSEEDEGFLSLFESILDLSLGYSKEVDGVSDIVKHPCCLVQLFEDILEGIVLHIVSNVLLSL